MAHQYRALGIQQTPGTWQLDADEAHHIAKVLRLGVGDEIEVFNGTGVVGVGVIGEVSAKSVTVSGVTESNVARPVGRLVMCLGALRPGEVDDVLPGLVELGMDEIVVFGQEGSSRSNYTEKVQERWRAIAVNACKQSKRAWLADVRWCDDLKHALDGQSGTFLQLDEHGVGFAEVSGMADENLTCIVGSEKGLSASEISILATVGAKKVRIGSHILRARTAALVGAGMMAAVAGR